MQEPAATWNSERSVGIRAKVCAMSWTRLGLFPLIGLALAAEMLAGAQPQPERVEPSLLIKKDNRDLWINKILFSPDGRYLLTNSMSPKRVPWQKDLPYDLGVTKTGGMAIVKIWELPRGNLVRILEVHHGGLNAWVMNDADGLLATGGDPETNVKIWEIPSGHLVQTLDGVNFPLKFFADGARFWVSHRGSLSFGKDGPKFESFDDRTAYDVATWKPIATSKAMLLAGNGTIGGVDVKDAFEIRHALTGEVVRQLPVPWTSRRALSHDGSRFAFGRGSEDRVTVEVWNTQTGAQVWTESWERPLEPALKWLMDTAGVPDLVFSPDGTTLIGWDGHNSAVRLWGADKGRQRSIGQSSGTKMQVRDVAFSADGSLLAIRRSSELISDTNPSAMPRGKSIGTVTFVRVSTLESVGEITLPSDARGSEMSRDLSYVATLERDGTVRIWRAPSLAR